MKRIIPLVLLRRGMVVRAERFSTFQKIGNPIDTIRRLSSWSVDELIVLETMPDCEKDPYLTRKDIETTFYGGGLQDLTREINRWTFAPLTVGGGIRTTSDMRALFSAGADKVCINTAAVENPSLIQEAATEFGSQSITVSIDAIEANGCWKVTTHGASRECSTDVITWAKKCENLGAGELLINAVARDGCAEGMDNRLLRAVQTSVNIPVIGVGGVGHPEHVARSLAETGIDAVAVGNYFHFKELSYPNTKTYLFNDEYHVRAPRLDTDWFSREPTYDAEAKRERLSGRLSLARQGRSSAGPTNGEAAPTAGTLPEIRFCTRCVVPSSSAVPIDFDEDGVCSACRTTNQHQEAGKPGPHTPSDELIETILRGAYRVRRSSDYDCVIAVSGGKDSYFQTYYVKEVCKLNPLLVTYYGNNYTTEGEENLQHMSRAFGVDHLIVKPSVSVLKKLNRLGFMIMGDMNWQNHLGIATAPFRVASEKGIPFVIYGEHGYADLGGQFSPRDYVEWTYRHRLEHFARGYEWNYMVGFKGLSGADLSLFKYPSDSEIYKLGLRGLFLMNYVSWDGNQNADIAKCCGFRPSDVASQRTYRSVSNLDDMHENGIHDYLRWIKFGYGRCTDHACKDVRAGIITRDEARDLVRKYDHRKPDDLHRWLKYVGMRESTFDRIADTFRDPRVWARQKDGWAKQNVWDC